MNFSNYIRYEINSGRIVGQLNIPPEWVELQELRPGRALLEGEANADEYFVDTSGETPVISPRSPVPHTVSNTPVTSDGVDTAIINLVEIDSYSVQWPDGVVTEVNDGVIEYSVDYPGMYTFIIESVKHLPTEVTIEAIAPGP